MHDFVCEHRVVPMPGEAIAGYSHANLSHIHGCKKNKRSNSPISIPISKNKRACQRQFPGHGQSLKLSFPSIHEAHSLTHSLTLTLTHSLTLTLTPSLTSSLLSLLTHSFSHSLTLLLHLLSRTKAHDRLQERLLFTCAARLGRALCKVAAEDLEVVLRCNNNQSTSQNPK